LREREQLANALQESEARYRRLLLTEQQQRSQAEAAEATLRGILAASPQPILVLDLEGYVKSWNAAAEQTLGWTAEEIINRPLPTIPETARDAANAVFVQLVAGETIVGMEVRRQKKDGSWIDLSISAAPLRNADGRITSIVEVYADVTERKRAEKMLEYLALHDSLTDLPNRTLLKQRVEEAILASEEGSSPFAVLLLDLDQFKEVNDTLGHHAGDLVLKQVAGQLRQSVRDTDTVARLGGDEFAVLLPGAAVAGEILRDLKRPLLVEGKQINIETSIGGAVYPEDGHDSRALLHQADISMYAAKRAGSGYVAHVSQHGNGALTRRAP
jgi:diguanylate cyclase (GGDEF)-like protein/PAS domain S-box-containing protein